MPKQHRRTYGAIFEVMLASAFTLLPFLGYLLAGNPDGFRLIALPGGLALVIVPLLVHFGLPESARWYLRRGNPQAAVETVNWMIKSCGNRAPRLTVQDLGPDLDAAREALPHSRRCSAPANCVGQWWASSASPPHPPPTTVQRSCCRRRWWTKAPPSA